MSLFMNASSRRLCREILILTALLGSPLNLAWAQTAAPAAPATNAPVVSAPAAPAASADAGFADRLDKAIHKSRQPVPWWKWTADLRLRNEYQNNTITLNEHAPRHEQDYFRFRARQGNVFSVVTNLDFNLRLTWEGREWVKPSYHAKPVTGWEWSEGIIDNLNAKITAPFNMPATFTVGRQDMLTFGEGYVILDGTPLDGSRTAFLDAARLNLNFKEQNTTVDLIGILQESEADAWLPPINDRNRPLVEQDEHGAVLYVSNKSIKNTQIDGYFIYKNMERVAANGDDGDIYAVGSRVSGSAGSHVKYRAEGVVEVGEKNDRDLMAYGFNSEVSYHLNDPLQNQFRLTYELSSGDDPDTADNEQMDLLWARWPRWSELYIYSYIQESRVSEVVNFHRIGPGWTFLPHKKLQFLTDYYALFAFEDQPMGWATSPSKRALFTGSGDFRGHMLRGILKYRHNEHIAAHLWSEFIWQGDYYTQRDLMTFLRAEIMLTW